jgi:hypothetical protein
LRRAEEVPVTVDEPYELSSLGDLIERLIDGWQIEGLHYADSCAPVGPADAPGAFFELRRPDAGKRRVFIPDDGRAFSHRSVIELFRDRPHIWKHRSPSRFPDQPEAPPGPPRLPDEWGEVPGDFPEGLGFAPGELRSVIAVNQSQSADGVTVAATALEIFEAGARLRYLAHAEGGAARRDLDVLETIAIDDAGRLYRVEQLPSDRRGNRVDGALAIAPAPPVDTSRLTVTIGTVGDSVGDPARGPWVFPMVLRESE